MTRPGFVLRHRLSGQTMGTEWSLQWCAPSSISETEVRLTLEAVFTRIINQMSTWERASEISRFNQLQAGSKLKIREDFQLVLREALLLARQSHGAFDPTLGGLITERGFGSGVSRFNDTRASFGSGAWEYITPKSGMIKQPGGVQLDLSAMAKGYAVDQMIAALHPMGITQCLAEIGGEFRGSGVKPDGLPWWVDLEKESHEPSQRQNLDVVPIRIGLYNLSLASSGGFRQSIRTKAGRVSHIVPAGSVNWTEANDPTLSSVSVLHKDCMWADGWATALFSLGLEDGLAMAEDQGVMAVFQRVGCESVFSTAVQSLRL